MLLGRRLLPPQPALPGWSSKPPPAVVTALASQPARLFSSTIPLRLGSHGRDPNNIFLALRLQLEAETKAKQEARQQEARQQVARQNQQASRTNGHAMQRAAPIQPKRQSEKTATSTDPTHETAVHEQADSLLQHPPEETWSTPEQDDTLAKKYPMIQTKSKGMKSDKISEETKQVAGRNPWFIRRIALANATQTPSTSLSSDDRQKSSQDLVSRLAHNESHQDASETSHTKPSHTHLQKEDARALQNLRALAQQLGLDTRGIPYTDLKRAIKGKKSWTVAPLPVPKSVADTSKDKIEGSTSNSHADRSGTVAVKTPDPGLQKQIAASEPLVKFRRVPIDPSQQGQPTRRNGAMPPENVEQTTPSKARMPEVGDNSASSVFAMLFPDEETEKPKPMLSGPKSLGAGVERGESGPGSEAEKHFPDFDSKSSHLTESIFAKLFPEEAEQELEGKEAGEPQDTLKPPEDTVFVSLRNEVRNWIPTEDQDEIVAPEPGEYGSHSTVITIWGISHSLIETDFYRIIPESKHVEGWAGGLIKIVQARELLNQKPLGRYYLMFHSRPSAVAYAEEARRLHALSRKLLHPSGTGLSPPRGRLDDAPVDPQPFISKEEEAAVRSFTLCSPDAPINLKIEILTTTKIREIAADGVITDVVQALQTEADIPAKVLVTVTLPGGASPEPGKHGLSTDDLWLTLRDDGRERGVPWSLVNLTEGIMPVKTRPKMRPGEMPGETNELFFEAEPVAAELGLGKSGSHKDEDEDEDEGLPGNPMGESTSSSTPKNNDDVLDDGANQDPERYNRFILSFIQRSQAKRFVRCWHKRAINDASMDRHVVIDAVALL